MSNIKTINKYYEYDRDYFSDQSSNHTYSWYIDGIEYVLDWDCDKNLYIFTNNQTGEEKEFSNIYSALNNIKFHNKSLRQLLIETNFDFDCIW